MKFYFLFGFTLVFGFLSAFPPPDEKDFINNCLRLLNTQQYSYLTQYFEEYFPRFKDSSSSDYIEQMVTRIPFTDKKESILKTYINYSSRVSPFAYDLYGQIKLFEKDYREVIRAYQRYDQPERFYYLGLAEKELGNLIEAKEWFLQAGQEVQNKEIKQFTYLGLAEIYIRWENFAEARKFLRRVSNRNYRKSILYYYLYKAEKNEDYLKRIIKKIKSYPQNDPIIKEFMEKEKLD